MKSEEIVLTSLREGLNDFVSYESEKKPVDYELELINTHCQSGFLKCIYDGSFKYEVNGYMDFKRALLISLNSYELIYNTLLSIVDLLSDISDYMLREDGFIIRSDSVYISEETKNVGLIYVPGECFDIKDDFITFVEFIMKHMDHKDNKAVLTVYGVYHILKEEHYDINKVKEFLLNESDEKQALSFSVDDISNQTSGAIKQHKSSSIKQLENVAEKQHKHSNIKWLKHGDIKQLKFDNIKGFDIKNVIKCKDVHRRNEIIIVAMTAMIAVVLFILGNI